MSKFAMLSFIAIFLVGAYGCSEKDKTEQEDLSSIEHSEKEKPIQHLNLPDITSRERAVDVMDSTTAELKSKKTLNEEALSEIHYITYSLEKAVAYFVENSSGEQQAAAREMAAVVEEVHLHSENNRIEETRKALDQYYELHEPFRRDL